jgi:hypothetical protein
MSVVSNVVFPLLTDSKTRENQRKREKYAATKDMIDTRRRENYAR